MTKRPTQKDIARIAGVSRVTVSMVLNGKTNGSLPISDLTRDRVLQTAQALGYSPNPIAQMLKQGNNHLLGVFIYEHEFPYDTNSYLFHHLIGVEREAARQDYNIVFFTRNQRTGNPKIFVNDMNSIHLADGAIIMGAHPDREELRRLVQENYPFVCIGRRVVPASQVNWVSDDYASGGAQAVQHLLNLGHQKIGYLVPANLFEAHEDKLRGMMAALEENPAAELLIIPGEPLDQNLPRLLEDQKITALVCENYMIFESCAQVLYDAQFSIPEDISLLSLTPLRYTLPYKLLPTYVQLDRQTVGESAVQLLVERLNNRAGEVQQKWVPCQLVIGETTGAVNERRKER
jgi:LacI family transcriptional regulator